MARIIGIDYGSKKCGVSVTDPLQIIVSPLDAVPTKELEAYLLQYFIDEKVEKVVLGRPTHKDGSDTYLVSEIEIFVDKLRKKAPEMEFDYADETLTSQRAKKIIFQSGVKKSKRRDKTLIDKVSAVLILQQYLRHI